MRTAGHLCSATAYDVLGAGGGRKLRGLQRPRHAPDLLQRRRRRGRHEREGSCRLGPRSGLQRHLPFPCSLQAKRTSLMLYAHCCRTLDTFECGLCCGHHERKRCSCSQ